MATIANIIEANSPGVLDYLIYPDQNPINQSYLYQQVANVATTFNEIGKRFMEGSREIYERINNADMIRKAKAAIKKAFQAQINGEGFTMVEVLSTCPTNWGLHPVEALKWLEDNMIPYYPLGNFKNVDGEAK